MPDKPKAKRVRRDRTQEILQTATRLFSEKGYRGTSLASIADQVGLTEPGLLHYFPTKVHLLMGVLEYREKEDTQKYSGIEGFEISDTTYLFSTLQKLVLDNQEKPALIRLFTVLVAESIRPDHPAHAHFIERYTIGRQTYKEIFKQLQDDGKIRDDIAPEQLGALIMAIMDGLQIQWLLDPKNVDMQELFEAFSKILDAYLTENKN